MAYKNLLYVGRICSEKGLHVIIDALNILVNEKKYTKMTLNVYGEGSFEYLNIINKKINEYKLNKKVIFYGKIDHKEILKIYCKYDLLIVPSIWNEPFGLIITEAMAHGVPVLASKIGGIVDIIDDRETGILMQPGDYVDMVHKIKTLDNSPDLIKSIIQNALKKFNENFSNEIVINKIERHLYNTIKSNSI
jgi:teichuronic acid biosynthesis glycosyltransferase TuaC